MELKTRLDFLGGGFLPVGCGGSHQPCSTPSVCRDMAGCGWHIQLPRVPEHEGHHENIRCYCQAPSKWGPGDNHWLPFVSIYRHLFFGLKDFFFPQSGPWRSGWLSYREEIWCLTGRRVTGGASTSVNPVPPRCSGCLPESWLSSLTVYFGFIQP